MKSLSRIIRGVQAQQLKTHTIEIQLRDIFESESLVETLEPVEQEITIEEVLEERNRLLEEAKQLIDKERAEFEQYLAAQKESIEQLKRLWEEEKIQLQQLAHEEAFSQGYEEGRNKAITSMEQHIVISNETMVHARQNAEKYLVDQEQVILDLALKCAEKIIGYELDSNEEAFLSIIKRGLKEVRELENIKIYVAPEYYALITKHRDELAEMFPPDVQFLIFVNEDLQTLESYIETSQGRVIVSIDEQLTELRIKLNEILGSKE